MRSASFQKIIRFVNFRRQLPGLRGRGPYSITSGSTKPGELQLSKNGVSKNYVDVCTKFGTFMAMKIIVLKQCQKEIEEFPMVAKEQLTDYLELLTLGEVLLPPASKSLSAIAGCDLFAARIQEENPAH